MFGIFIIVAFKLALLGAYAQEITSLFIPGNNETDTTETLSAVIIGVGRDNHTTFLIQETSLRGPNDLGAPLTLISGSTDVTASGDISTVIQSDNVTATVEAHTTALCTIHGSNATCTETMAITFGGNNTVSTSFVESTSVALMAVLLGNGTTLTASPAEPTDTTGTASGGQSSIVPTAGSSSTSSGAQPVGSQNTTGGGNSAMGCGIEQSILAMAIAVLIFSGLIS